MLLETNNILTSDKKLGQIVPNIATLLFNNKSRFSEKMVYQEKKENVFVGITWNELYNDILNIAYNLKQIGFSDGDKLVIYSPNQLEMLQLELAVMSIGGIAVPIFAWFKKDTAELLIEHSDAKFLAVAGTFQLSNISIYNKLKNVFVFDDVDTSSFHENIVPFKTLLKERENNLTNLYFNANPNDICLNMYTSGTMGIPKCVQLSHKNILSQQAALDAIDWWSIDENDKFLSYLPWHHSFGGIFELFNALYRGATYTLEPSYGKNIESILENWKIIKPTIFFSVPKVYQMLFELIKENNEPEAQFFHPNLKFIFTAAAALPENLSKEFEKRKVPVIEGWGLTETSPCCSLTNPLIKRNAGTVGLPIPGISIRLGEENEIQVLGPNTMCGYYKNDEANKNIFTEDGWFKTGDIGTITEDGLKLITRKDRIFKLTNGEKVIPTEMENLIQSKCHYISFAIVSGSGQDYPVALLFPNYKMLETPIEIRSEISGCSCPKNLNELGNCLNHCLQLANADIGQKFSKIKSAVLINDELSFDKNTLTPSLKVAPNNVMNVYKAHLENLYGQENEIKEEVYVIKLDS